MSDTYLPASRLIESMQRHPVRDVAVPREYRMSWPLPVRRGDTPVLAGFFYAASGRPGEPRLLMRPRFLIVVDPRDGSLLQFTDTRYQDFAVSVVTPVEVGELRNEDLPTTNVDELLALQEQLKASYDALLPVAFADRDSLSGETIARLARFSRLYRSLVEPPMRPFYQALSPGFDEWLGLVAG